MLDLDPRDILHHDRIAHDDILRLADIDAGIRCAADIDAVDQHVAAFDRIDALGAVGVLWPSGPFEAQLVIGRASRRERVCPYGSLSVGGVTFKTTNSSHTPTANN